MNKRPAKLDRRQVRIQNKLHHLLDLFRQRGELSKVEAKRQSGYAMSTVLALFDRLRRSRLIVSAGVQDDQRRCGPKRELYRLNGLRRLYLGITFTQSGIYSVIVSFSGEVLRTCGEPLDITGGQREFLSRLRGHLDRLRRENSDLLGRLACVGMSLPGEIDKDRGVLLSYAFMPHLKGIDFRPIIADYFPKVPCRFEQNITGFLSCLLMDRDYVSRYPMILFISLRSGLANGVICDGRIVTATGEIAHTQVVDTPDRCVCGRTGCLDMYLSHKALSDSILQHLRGSGAAAGQDYLTIPEIIAAYRDGGPAMRSLIDSRFSLLSRAVVNAANLLAPNLIVLSGELFDCFDDPAAAIRRFADESFADGGYIHRFAAARLVYRSMGTEASAIGLCYGRIKADFAYQVEQQSP